MIFSLGRRSRKELVGVHPALVDLVERAICSTAVDFAVHDGIRTIEEQRALVAAGASKTMNSRHLTGHAVDLVPYIAGRLSWKSMGAFKEIAKAMREASASSGTPIVWGASRRYGGDWTWNDAAHFELPRGAFPSEG